MRLFVLLNQPATFWSEILSALTVQTISADRPTGHPATESARVTIDVGRNEDNDIVEADVSTRSAHGQDCWIRRWLPRCRHEHIDHARVSIRKANGRHHVRPVAAGTLRTYDQLHQAIRICGCFFSSVFGDQSAQPSSGDLTGRYLRSTLGLLLPSLDRKQPEHGAGE